MSIKVFLSFSGLLSQVSRGTTLVDSFQCLYVFGCMKEGIKETLNLYRLSHDKENEILNILKKAEEQGRVRWRQNNDTNKVEWLIKKLKTSFNIDISENYNCNNKPENMNWNIVALRRWLEETIPGISVVVF